MQMLNNMCTVAVVSDTHGVADPEVVSLALAAGATLFLHAGDVGNHGGEEGEPGGARARFGGCKPLPRGGRRQQAG